MKKVLAVSYSQTGQLTNVVNSFVAPLKDSSEIEVVHEIITPVKPYPFPWPPFDFFDVFPECVALVPCEIYPLKVTTNTDFDLIIVAYQTWFLSPSPPITAFLKSEAAKILLKNKPVVTLIGARNMWLFGQEVVKELLLDLDAILIDNVVLVDQDKSIRTLISTPRWMWTGNKEPFWRIFPEAGISQNEIKNASIFGKALTRALSRDLEKEKMPLLKGLKAVEVNVWLIYGEKIIKRNFKIWSKILRIVGKQGDFSRKPVLVVYFCFLVFMIVITLLVGMVVRTLLQWLRREKLEKQKIYFENPSGSADFRVKDF
jgi:hypothetical protein